MSLTCLLNTELPPFAHRDGGSLGAWEAPRRHWGSDGASGPEERARCTPDPQEHKAHSDTGRFKNLAAYGMETTVTLEKSLDDRVVIDAGTGMSVARIPRP